MGQTRLAKAKVFLKLLKMKHGEVITFDTLLDETRFNLGDDRRTTKPYIELMLKAELIEEKQSGVWIK